MNDLNDGRIRSYQDLRVWQEAMGLAEECYFLTRDFPKSETYGMTSQIRRSAASIPANIAEGYGRDNPGNYIQSLRIAQGSLKELETHLILASRVELVTERMIYAAMVRAENVGKMLRSLIRSLQDKADSKVERLPTAEARLPKRSAQ